MPRRWHHICGTKLLRLAKSDLELTGLHRLVDGFTARVEEVAGRLAAIPGRSAGVARKLLSASLAGDFSAHLAAEAKGIAHCAAHDEARAALDAFLNR